MGRDSVARRGELVPTEGRGDALRIMLGLDDETRGLSLGPRRELASQAVGVKAGTFRSHHENRLLDSLAQQLALALLPESPPVAKPNRNVRWHQWTPHNAVADTDTARAVDAFQGLDTPAGAAAADWLRNESLAAHPSSITYLYLVNDRLQGFFAMSSGAILLSQSQRRQINPQHVAPAMPTQGASVVHWLARHRDADPLAEPDLIMYAIAIASKVAQLQGTVALVLHPFDEVEADAFADRYGFRHTRAPRDTGRDLWIPLHPV